MYVGITLIILVNMLMKLWLLNHRLNQAFRKYVQQEKQELTFFMRFVIYKLIITYVLKIKNKCANMLI